MLIIINCESVTAGTKCVQEHICNCLLKAMGRDEGIPLMKNYFRISFIGNNFPPGVMNLSTAYNPRQVLCVLE